MACKLHILPILSEGEPEMAWKGKRKPNLNIINIFLGSNPLMLRSGLYGGILNSLIAKNQHGTIVDKSFHSVMEWAVYQKRFWTC